MTKAAKTIGIGLLLAIILSSCGYKTPADSIAIQVGNGASEAQKVKGCKAPSTRQHFWETNDTYVYLPTNEREWDATGQDGSDADPFVSVTKDSVQMKVPVTVRFTLDTADCDLMKALYTRYIRRYGAEYDKGDGSTNGDWKRMIRKLVGDPSDQTIDRIIQQYPWRKVWNDPTTKTAIEQQANDALTSPTSLLVQTGGEPFFTDIKVLVGSPRPENEELAIAVAEEQTNVAKSQSLRAQAEAQISQARAETARAKAEAAKQRAEISGYPSVDAYLKALCITQAAEAGTQCNVWQPTYLVSGTQR